MTLGRKLACRIGVLVLCTALVGAAALLGLAGLSRHFDVAEQQYDELRALYEIGHRASAIRMLLDTTEPDHDFLRTLVVSAVMETDQLLASRGEKQRTGDDPFEPEIRSIREHLLRVGEQSENDADLTSQAANVNASLARIASLAGATKTGIIGNRRAATERFRATANMIGLLLAVTLVVAIMIGFLQYRSVMRPLRSLESGIARVSAARFRDRIRLTGEREFRRLIHHFNGMAAEIARLHGSMQSEIETKSQQLVRSEQLAAVGHLAAGLAHEINNPLGIIAGYTESALQRLDSDRDALEDVSLRGRLKDALGIISEETFRCADITNQLLELAQPAPDESTPVLIANVVQRTADLLSGLPMFGERRLTLYIEEPHDALVVLGNESQLTQVVINVLTNALEATAAQGGSVGVTVRRHEDAIDIIVTDDGCGMTDDMLTCAFDPFWTDKPQRGLSGTGLGLAVSQAIVERHGGRLLAHSDGPGRGSTFTIALSAATHERVACHA